MLIPPLSWLILYSFTNAKNKYTPPKFNSSPMKGAISKGKAKCLPVPSYLAGEDMLNVKGVSRYRRWSSILCKLPNSKLVIFGQVSPYKLIPGSQRQSIWQFPIWDDWISLLKNCRLGEDLFSNMVDLDKPRVMLQALFCRYSPRFQIQFFERFWLCFLPIQHGFWSFVAALNELTGFLAISLDCL